MSTSIWFLAIFTNFPMTHASQKISAPYIARSLHRVGLINIAKIAWCGKKRRNIRNGFVTFFFFPSTHNWQSNMVSFDAVRAIYPGGFSLRSVGAREGGENCDFLVLVVVSTFANQGRLISIETPDLLWISMSRYNF